MKKFITAILAGSIALAALFSLAAFIPNPVSSATSNYISALVATPVLSNRVNLRWQDVAGETQYIVERSTSQASGYSQIGIVNANVTDFTDTGTAPNSLYWYRVRVINGSSEVGITTFDQVQTPPSGGNVYYISPNGSGSTCSADSPCATFAAAYDKMASGDTLIVKDGTYIQQRVFSTKDENDKRLTPSIEPPPGTAAKFTRVVAEHDGAAIVDGQNVRQPINADPYGKGAHHIEIRGIVFRRQAGIGAGTFLYGGVNNIRFIRDGFEDTCNSNCATFGVTNTNNILVEESYAWGNGRYKFLSYRSSDVVFRRTVARMDRVTETDRVQILPVGTYSFYESNRNACQNCISIDGDKPQFWDVTRPEWSGSYYVPSTAGLTSNIQIDGSIAYNVDMQFGGLGFNLSNISLNNIVGWNIREGVSARDSATYNHITFGNLYGPSKQVPEVGIWWYPYDHHPTPNLTVNNSILYKINGTALQSVAQENYNVFYQNTKDRADSNIWDAAGITPLTPTGSRSVNADPGLKYILSAQGASSAVVGKGSDGKDIGATIVKRIGNPGTFYGQSGYNVTTNDDLWPFPFESVMAREMRNYTYQTLSGNRGFAARSGPTPLTDYLWTALGNPNPYNSASVTPTPPATTYAISATAGTGGTISPSGTTNVVAGNSQTFTITPSTGYQTSNVTVDGASVGTVPSYTFTNVNAAHTITATFSQQTATTTPPTTGITVGSRVKTTTGTLNIRSSASSAGTLVGTQPNGAQGSVVAGPTTASGFTWWNVNFDSGVDGWAVQDYLTLSTTPTPPPDQPPTNATAFFVSPNGNDSNNGTSDATAWRTLQKAADTVPAGSTVTVRAGNYVGFTISRSGTASSRITFKADPNATITSKNSRTADGINLEGASYVTIEGFKVNGGNGITRAGIRSVTNSNAIIRNNIVDGLKANSWGILTGFSENVLIENNTTINSGVQHGIYVSNSADNPIVRGNTIYGNGMTGILLNGDCSSGGDGLITGALVENNTIRNNSALGISFISAANSTIRNNIIYNNGVSGAAAIHLTDQTPGANGQTFCGKPSSNNTVVNNTIVEPNLATIRMTNGAVGNIVFNNLLVSSKGQYVVNETSGTQNIGATSNVNRTSTTGLFVNAAGGDFHLVSSSPAINVGVASYTSKNAPTTDISGTSRPQGTAYDAGAYEFSGTVTPPPSNTFTIAASAGTGGSISPSGTATVNSGDSKVYTITANSGYQISNVSVNGISVGAVSSYTFANVTSNQTIAATFTQTTTTPPPPTGGTGTIVGMSVSNRENILTNASLKNAGLNYWPDGNMGVIKNGSTYTIFAANGSSIGRAVGTLNNPISSSASSRQIGSMKNSYNYAAGGPVYKDPATGTLIMVYHAEKWIGGDLTKFWSLLGMARSTDGGSTWTDLGEIISPEIPFGNIQHEVTGGTVAIVGDYFYVYYRDLVKSGSSNRTNNLAVARARISDVVSAAQRGTVTPFTKYANGSWSSAGLGGTSSALESGNPGTNFMAVSYNTHIGKYIIALVTGSSNWNISMIESTDGVNWSSRVPVETEGGESYAPSIVSTGTDTTTTGQQFYIYYAYSNVGSFNRWNDAVLARRTVTLGGATNPPPPTTFTITASAGTGGSISSSGVTTLNSGGSKTYTITANSGYVISNVAVNGISAGAVNTFTFTNVTANQTIAATFTQSPVVDPPPPTGTTTPPNQTTYTITAAAASGGTISPSGAVSVASGGSQTFTMTPNSGYQLGGIFVNGSPAGVVGTYTFSNVTSNQTISASFKMITTTPPPSSTPISIWSDSATPQNAAEQDTLAVEVGLKFRSSVSGTVSGIKYYKSSANTGTHTGRLWKSDGTLLGSVTFTNETSSGWQKAMFSAPIAISANTTYIVSYHAPNGRYADDINYFTQSRTSGQLTALRDGTSGPNGVYAYGPAGSFPTKGYKSSNYWVDVIFTPTSSVSQGFVGQVGAALQAVWGFFFR